jgi:carboxypeptidase C (cathepsin A)
MRQKLHWYCCAVALMIFASAAGAQRQGRPPDAPPAQERQAPQAQAAPERRGVPPVEKISQTQHTVRVGGQEIKYTAAAGTMVLKADDGSPKASAFFVAYTRDDVTDLSKRPVTFAYNGGPGSASIWLHMGALGPMKVLLQDDGHALPPPPKLVENENSILDVTDLVFIDPISTGFSRPAPGENPNQFHGVREDTEWVSEFIRTYITRFNRWGSPKFLAGESYGTTRSASLSGYLQQRFGIYLNGIVLISAVLNFQTISFAVGNDLPAVLFLPTYTATAWYHKKLPPDLQGSLPKALQEAREFAAGEYNQALMKGDKLPDAERARVAQKLARLTGLTPKYIEQTNLRINIGRFTKELLRDQRRTVGRIDSRFTGMDLDAAGERYEFDPSQSNYSGAFTQAFNDYVRRELKFESDLAYEVSGPVRPWNYAPYENSYVNVAETLRSAMTQNQALRVLIANGYYDLATPFFGVEYTVDHLGLDPTLRGHVSMTYYEAGHMMYIDKASHAKLKKDIAEFIRATLSSGR